MRLRIALSLLALLLASGLSGCVDNMDGLKEALGVRDPAPPPAPEPAYAPPLAKAQANATDALVLAPIRFTSEGSRDPQGLPLTFHWTFGDGASAEGPVVTHAFAEPGEYRVTLNVSSAQGLSDEDILTLRITAANRPPAAAFIVRDAAGVSITSGEQGQRLRFDGTASADPDNDTLTYLWTFGDGTTSIEATPEHAYDKPGLHTVRLKVDDGRTSHEASRILTINGSLDARGEFTLAGSALQTHALHVADGAQTITVTLTFDAAVGANDLYLTVKDAAGAEAGTANDPTPPGAQGQQTRTVTFAGDYLRTMEEGEWSLEVHRAKGVQVAYRLVARETF